MKTAALAAWDRATQAALARKPGMRRAVNAASSTDWRS